MARSRGGRTGRVAVLVPLVGAVALAAAVPARAAATAWGLGAFDAALGSGFDGTVRAVLPLPDGDVLVAGEFTALDGDAAIPDRLVRLNADGTPDTDTGTNVALGTGFDARVVALALAPDGGVLVGGEFTALDGDASAPDGLLRLAPTGTPDAAFSAALGSGFGFGSDSAVRAVVVAADGDVLVGGEFTALDGDAAIPDGLVRLNADGTRDAVYNAALGSGFDAEVLALAPTRDGDLLVGGQFTALDGVAGTPDGLVRLGPDGTPDAAFSAQLGAGITAGAVFTVAEAGDGDILVGGTVAEVDDVPVPYALVRLDAGGTLDTGTTFNDTAATWGRAMVQVILSTADGGVLVGGDWGRSGGLVPTALVRFDAAGELDTEFTAALGTGINGLVAALAQTADGAVLVGGAGRALNGDDAGTPDRLVLLVPTTLAVGTVADRTDVAGAAIAPFTPPATLTPAASTAPVTWSATGLPAGLTIDPATGEITGTPTAPGPTTVTLSASITPGATTATDTTTFAWTVLAAQAPAITGAPPVGVVGVPYDFTPLVTGAPAPVVSAVAGGPLPAGLVLDPATGRVSGTPTAPGTVQVEVTAASSAGTATRLLTVTVDPAPAPTLAVDRDQLRPGQQVTVTGAGFGPGDTVALVLAGAPDVLLGSAPADATGAFSVVVTVPAGTAPGSHTIVATGVSGTAAATFSVVADAVRPAVGTPGPGVASGQGGLAVTGVGVAAVALVAGAAAVAGVALLVLRRRGLGG